MKTSSTYSSTFCDAHSDRLQEGQAYHSPVQVREPSFTLQGWKSDVDDQDDQDDDDDMISHLTSVGLYSDSEPSKKCNVQEKTMNAMRQAPIPRLRKRKLAIASLSDLQHPLRVCIRDVLRIIRRNFITQVKTFWPKSS